VVYLALTPEGLLEAISASNGMSPIWCGAEAISEEDFSRLAAKDVTRFQHTISGPEQPAAIADALATIREHHPGHRVWVEHAPAL